MNTPETMTKHDFSDLTPPPELVRRDYPNLQAWTTAIYQAGAEQAAERLANQWPEPITRPPTRADADRDGFIQQLDRWGHWVAMGIETALINPPKAWFHTPRWQPPAPPTLTPQQQEAMDALDHILKHSTTNLGEATIRKAILGGEA